MLSKNFPVRRYIDKREDLEKKRNAAYLIDKKGGCMKNKS